MTRRKLHAILLNSKKICKMLFHFLKVNRKMYYTLRLKVAIALQVKIFFIYHFWRNIILLTKKMSS